MLTRSGNVEFVTTMTDIEKYLRPHARILEIGAGTGRYNHALCLQYHLFPCELPDLTGISAHTLDIFRKEK